MREAKIIGTEQARYKSWIKEAIEIRKKGGTTMNRDEGQYFLSRAFDEILMKKNTQLADQLATLKVATSSPEDSQHQPHHSDD